jgi:hypothetical protein
VLTNFVKSINPDIIVKYGKLYSSDIFNLVIYVGNNFYDPLQDDLIPYLYIDLGFDYTPYCKKQTWSLLHEIGHIMSMIDKSYNEKLLIHTIYDINIKKIVNDESLSLYKKVERYMYLDMELNANKWAYEYLIHNKNKIKEYENNVD